MSFKTSLSWEGLVDWRASIATSLSSRPGAAGRVCRGDAIVGEVLGPLGPRPVPLVVLGEGVSEPAGRDAGGGCTQRARRRGLWFSSGTLAIGGGR